MPTRAPSPDMAGQIPFILVVLVLLALYGGLVRRGTIAGRNILWAGLSVGAACVLIVSAYWWPFYRAGLPLALFLLNPVAMALCVAYCVGIAYRSQRVEDKATHIVGDTKIIVRFCSPSRLPDADVILLPTTTSLAMLDEAAGMIAMAAGQNVGQAARRQGPVGIHGIAVTEAGRLAAKQIVHVAVHDYRRPVDAEKLRRGIEQGAGRARKLGAESVVLPLAPMQGLTITQVVEATVAGVFKQRKAFGEIVFAVLTPRHASEVTAAIARSVEAGTATATGK